MIYDILEAKLVTAGFVIGATENGLFRSQMPASVTSGVMLRSPLAGIAIDPHIPGFYITRMQVISRHKDPVFVQDMAALAAETLFVETLERYEATLEHGPAHISQFYPETLPIIYPRLDSNLYEASQHFNAAFGFSKAA